MPLTADQIRQLPTVVLHDHLDGGLRPTTVLELCAELGIDPPAADARGVADWFFEAADSGSLPRYLATFDRTLALLQRPQDLRRAAREFVEDMAADGVVYAETRWAPEQHLAGGLDLAGAVDAVQAGLEEGTAAAAARGQRILAGQLLCHLRHLPPTDALVRLAAERRDAGVWGVDLAGPEAGFPASLYAGPFALAREQGVHVTIHAGEADGPASIADALDQGAERLGHGVRIIEDVAADGSRGPVAARVHEQQVVLEVCPSSNLQTGAFPTIAAHPAGRLHRDGFALGLSSDNRLMSRTGTTREIALLADANGWELTDLAQITRAALAAGFAPAALRERILAEQVRPAYAGA